MTQAASPPLAGDAPAVLRPVPAAPVSPARAWFAVAVLCLAQIASTVDRGMLALVVDPVRADLGIDDMQIAWLQGFAFAVFYVSVGLPLGYVADRLNRRWLLVAGILVWSAATIGSGLARGFGDLFVGRLIVGVGEAVLGPCAVGMIGEMFPAHRRGRPMALYVLGSMVAYGLGAAVTGQILQAAPQGAFAGVPLLGALAPWRVAFVLMGAIGVPVAVLLALLGQAARSRGVAQARSGGVWAAMSARWRVLVPLYGSLALFAMGAAAATGWSAAMLTRHFHMSVADAGKGLGAAQIVWALVGAGCAAWLVDRVSARGGAAGKMVLAAGVALATIPSCMGAFMPGAGGAIALCGEVMAASAIYGATMLSVISEVLPARARGFAVALYAFVMTMIGGSLGPFAVAGLTQHVFARPEAVGWSMAIVGALALGASAALGLVSARAARNMAELEQQEGDIGR